MKPNPEPERHERQDWGIVLVILLLGFCCVLFAGQWALRFAPNWQADTDMESNINLDSEYLTNKPSGFFEPLDPAILTPPGWMDLFLTPGADFVTGTPLPPPTATVPTIPGTIPVATNTLAVTTSPTNTLVWFPLPATATSKPKPPPADTPTNTAPPPPPSADLWITNDDGATAYVPGDPRTYTIVVSNAGPSNITGATVTDNFPAQILTANWTCAGVGGGSCTAAGAGNINDLVNLPVGSSVTYTVNVTTDPGNAANLVNTASVTGPVGYTEVAPGNESQTDTDTLITTDPPGNVNTGLPDGSYYDLPAGSTLTLNINLTADGNTADWDLAYYELENAGPPPFILLDWIVIEISDGYNWYTVYNWGNGVPDGNTNVAIFGPETDEYNILSGPPLYNNTGVAIDIDSIVPPGPYLYIRFTSPTSGVGPPADPDADIDAIEILP